MEGKTEGNPIKPRIGIANIERRKYPRFSIDLPIEYSHLSSSITHPGRALNASEGGLLVYLPEKMEIGQRLHIKLFFHYPSTLNVIEMITEVVWIDLHLSEGWGSYRCGVKFIDISPDHLTVLKDLLASLSK
ncbi:MAG: PilZ domain-containing protein [Thermodesulfobacteriota bacterium]